MCVDMDIDMHNMCIYTCIDMSTRHVYRPAYSPVYRLVYINVFRQMHGDVCVLSTQRDCLEPDLTAIRCYELKCC